MAEEPQRFLPRIASALAAVREQGDEISTASMAALFDSIITVFDHLGPVLHFAKQDMHSKCESLKEAAATHATLRGLVDAGAYTRNAGRGPCMQPAYLAAPQLVAQHADPLLRSPFPPLPHR